MIDTSIICPSCKTEFPLTASLAAPLVEQTRREFEERLAAKETEVVARLAAERGKIAAEEAAKAKVALDAELGLKQSEIATLQDVLKQRNEKLAEAQKAQADLARQRQALEDAKNELDATLAERLRAEREKIAADAEKKARLSMQDDMLAKTREIGDLQLAMEAQREKLLAAQNAQAQLLQKQRELEDAKAQLQLDIQKGIQEGLDAAREQARKDAEESLHLKLAASQHTIDTMSKQIEDLKRKAEQGSQQLQGEVLELELEARLGAQFPMDTIVPVPKGEHGGDAMQTVIGPLGTSCGKILWESKNTKTWMQGWLQKLKDDQNAAKAELAVIVTQTLPKECETFDSINGIWVTNAKCAIPLAVCLRQSLIELAQTRQMRAGQETKAELVYEYLTGPHFRQRVTSIMETFQSMAKDLAKEKRAILAQWAKREKQLERVIGATAGMYGDLQGIAGQNIGEIEGMGFAALEDQSDADLGADGE